MAKWFQKAVRKGRTKNLDGWSKKLPASSRRRRALGSRPSNWSTRKRMVSAGRALQALANVTQDRTTRQLAKSDAEYFFGQARRYRK